MSNSMLPTEIVKLYRIWNSINYRCKRPENKQYKNYGGRGIDICEEWGDFNKFCEDVGQCPQDGFHLDRRDNDKGYFKENCRWVSPKVNHRNKRNNRYYQTHLGKICQSEWIEKIGFTRKQFKRAIEKYGEKELIERFANNTLPKKRVISDFNEFIGMKFGKLLVTSLDKDKTTGARYFCTCDCGKKTRVSRHKLKNGLSKECKSCCKKGDKNPKRKNKLIFCL
jgi:hypothetical protein